VAPWSKVRIQHGERRKRQSALSIRRKVSLGTSSIITNTISSGVWHFSSGEHKAKLASHLFAIQLKQEQLLVTSLEGDADEVFFELDHPAPLKDEVSRSRERYFSSRLTLALDQGFVPHFDPANRRFFFLP
jgi:hypothetical protein